MVLASFLRRSTLRSSSAKALVPLVALAAALAACGPGNTEPERPVSDAGPDAPAPGSALSADDGTCAPTTLLCCQGDVGNAPGCQSHTRVCAAGYALTESSQCVSPPPRDAGSFACGTLRCDANTQVCTTRGSGIPCEGGTCASSYSCDALPVACASDRTCDCIKSASSPYCEVFECAGGYAGLERTCLAQ